MSPTDRNDQEQSRSRIRKVVARIPAGKVATYGDVAAHAGLPGRARQVGQVMGALPDGSRIPWHRVLNARGEVSERAGGGWQAGYQRHLLEEEGVAFDAGGRVDLDSCRWQPRARADRRTSRRGARTTGRIAATKKSRPAISRGPSQN